jgi:repressor LexA
MARKPMRYLTERQKAILEFIQSFQREHGIAPTHREICEEFGYSSYGTVYKHLKLLERKGYLTRDWNQKRGIQIVEGEKEQSPEPRAESEAGDRELPLYGRIAAGRPIEAITDQETIGVPGHLLSRRTGGQFVLRVVGDSMIEDGIHDGDFVIVLGRKEADPGDMVVALVEGEVTLKRLYPEGEWIRLQPANAAMDPIRVPARQVQVQGVVVGLMRKYQ